MALYSDEFYEIIRNASDSSSVVVVNDFWNNIYKPKTVIDVGCGEGFWGLAFEQLGAMATGVDGDYVQNRVLKDFIEADLSKGLPIFRQTFDLAVCLEVAEHLPESRAASFVDDLCRVSRRVLFSAAIPGQGGWGHINEQWPEYWAELFNNNGYVGCGDIRFRYWDDENVEWWYKQNLSLYVHQDDVDKFDLEFNGVRPLVHPTLWESRL